MKTMHGALASACANRSRTRAAPTPTNFGFAGDRACQKRLASAGRTDEEHAFRNLAAKLRVLSRRLEKLDDLPQFLRRLVYAGDIGEAHLDVVFGKNLRLAARKRHDAAFGAPDAAEEKGPQGNKEQQRHNPAEDLGQPAAHNLAGILDAVRLQILNELRILDACRRKRCAALVAFAFFQLSVNRRFANRDLGNLGRSNETLELAVRDLAAARRQQVRLAKG
jgi:hypothetical protein